MKSKGPIYNPYNTLSCGRSTTETDLHRYPHSSWRVYRHYYATRQIKLCESLSQIKLLQVPSTAARFLSPPNRNHHEPPFRPTQESIQAMNPNQYKVSELVYSLTSTMSTRLATDIQRRTHHNDSLRNQMQ